ncbi:MAG: hypothetical protein J1E00_05510 [Oscillospiraceae bacterium]|nr:hypothetical protein [Oscillospiraceae bacterium]
MAPIEKNIAVVDELGNEYEPTYPKRAKGLVKHGRARFLSEDRICLACPPDVNLEEHNMSNRIEAVQAQNEPIAKSTANELNLSYILEQIARIQLETAYLNEAIEKLSMMGDAKESGPGFPPDIQGQAKANAIRDIVQCRETTNQQMLRFYERLYDDWRADHRKSEACAPTPPSDQVFFDALQLAIEKQSISASLLQMALGLGYAPANRLIERMEQQGFIGAFDPATKQRRVFITHEELAALKNNA